MKLELNDMEVLNILQSLKSEYVQAELYYKEHQNEQQRAGVISPEEIRDTYNEILSQAQEQGNLKYLKLMSK